MRNFHRDFEALNNAYDQKINKKPCQCNLTEAVSDDIGSIHRNGSVKQLREALKTLADAHNKDHSSLTYEDVYNEMKLYAEEKLTPEPVIPVPDSSPGAMSGMHNPSPMGIATEEVDEDDPKRDGPDYDPDGNKIDTRDDAEDNPGEGYVKEEGTDGETDDLTDLEKKKLKAAADKEKVDEDTSPTLEQQIEMLKTSDELQESDEEETDEDEEGLEETSAGGGTSQLAQAAGGVDPNLVAVAKNLSGGNSRRGLALQNPQKKVERSYGKLMSSVADQLNKQIKRIKNPPKPPPIA